MFSDLFSKISGKFGQKTDLGKILPSYILDPKIQLDPQAAEPGGRGGGSGPSTFQTGGHGPSTFLTILF